MRKRRMEVAALHMGSSSWHLYYPVVQGGHFWTGLSLILKILLIGSFSANPRGLTKILAES